LWLAEAHNAVSVGVTGYIRHGSSPGNISAYALALISYRQKQIKIQPESTLCSLTRRLKETKTVVEGRLALAGGEKKP
jgi:hypothetical protein